MAEDNADLVDHQDGLEGEMTKIPANFPAVLRKHGFNPEKEMEDGAEEWSRFQDAFIKAIEAFLRESLERQKREVE